MRSFWNDFKAFITRGNLLDLAVAFILGTAFAAVIRSLTDDILMPLVALVTGDTDFANRFVVLREGTPGEPYATLVAAKEAGAVVISYGVFINVFIAFLLAALVMFMVVRYVSRMAAFRRQQAVAEPPAAVKDCPYCRSKIDLSATRCAFCTSELGSGEAPAGAG